MAQVTERIRLGQFASVRDRYGLDQGSGGGWNKRTGELHMPVGRKATSQGAIIYRALLGKPGALFDWAKVYRLVHVRLWIRTTDNEQHIAKGASPSTTVRRLTAPWTYERRPEGIWTADHAVVTVPTESGSGPFTRTHAATGGKWRSLSLDAIFDALAPSSILGTDGLPGADETWYGLSLRATDEGSTANASEFNSPDDAESRAPWIEITYEANTPPLAPALSQPDSSSSGDPDPIASPNADTLIVIGVAQDPDAGQAIPTQQVQAFADTATDASPGTPLEDAIFEGLQNTFSVSLASSILVPRTPYRCRVRSFDGAWGAWSPLEDGRFELAYEPGVPTGLSFSGYGTSDNRFYASLESADSDDYITAHEIEVYYDPPAGGAIVKWAPGQQSVGGSSKRVEVAYGGTQLVVGHVIRWRIHLYNRDGIRSAPSAWRYELIEDQVGPTGMSPIDVETKLLTRTPSLTVGDGTTFDAHQVWLYAPTGELLHDSGLTTHVAGQSQSFEVPAGLYDWGDAPQWEAATRPVGANAVGTRSPRYTIQIASLPASSLISVEA